MLFVKRDSGVGEDAGTKSAARLGRKEGRKAPLVGSLSNIVRVEYVQLSVICYM